MRYHCKECDTGEYVSFDLCGECWKKKLWKQHNEERDSEKHHAFELDPSVSKIRRMGCFAAGLRTRLLMYRERPLLGVLQQDRKSYRWITNIDVYRASRTLATWFRVKNRVPEESKVAILGENSPMWCIASFSIVFAGLVTVPLAKQTSEDALAVCLKLADVCVAFCGPGYTDSMARILGLLGTGSSLKWLIVLAEDSTTKCQLDALKTVCTSIGIELVFFYQIVEAHNNPEKWEPIIVRTPESLSTLMYTSGSSGVPKAAMLPDRLLAEEFRILRADHSPVEILYMPLAYSSQFLLLLGVIATGGRMGFSSGDMKYFWEEVKLLEPTFLQAPPAIWESLHSQFVSELTQAQSITPEDRHKQLEHKLKMEFKKSLGKRLTSVSTGGAMTPPELLKWMRECFSGVDVREGYGTTEAGSITTNGYLKNGVQIRLQDCPDMGYLHTDNPPRGILWVKTEEMTLGYYNDKTSTSENFSEDGYFCTGDIVEYYQESHKLKILDRSKFYVKLSTSVWVAPESLQNVFMASPLVSSVFIYAEGLYPCVMASLVLNVGALRERLQQKGLGKLLSITAEQLREEPVVLNLILDEIRELGKRNGLQVYEVPHIIILETEAWTADNGLLTPSFKPNRKVLSRKYGPSLVALYEKVLSAPQTAMMNTLQASSESDISSEDTSDPILISAKRTLESELGLSGAKVLDTPLQAIGIDSITAIKLSKSFSHNLNIVVSPQAFIDQSSDTTLRELFTNSSSYSHQIHYDMKLEYKLPPEIEKDLAMCSSQPMPYSGSIFLTGATGFVGVHLVYKLLQMASPTSKIYCLVRTSKNAPESPTNKLKLALSRYSVNIPESVFEERIVCLNGDLGSHKFGISFADWRNLVEKVTCIIHNAAVTSSLQPYGSLRIPNVNGTMEAIRLACDFGTPKRFVYVSSLSVFCRSEFAKPTPILENTYLSPQPIKSMASYGCTKRVSELMVHEAQEMGLDAVGIEYYCWFSFANKYQFVDLVL